jgi:hypothetical protein
MTSIYPDDNQPGRYRIEGEDFALTCGELVEVCAQGRAWRPARIEHDGAGYVAEFTDGDGEIVRLQAGLPVRRQQGGRL